MDKTFNTRLEKARAKALGNTTKTRLKSEVAINDALRRESAKKLETIIIGLTEELGLDNDKMLNRLKRARKSAYGRVSEMITIIASIYAWPLADDSQISEMVELQERVIDTLANYQVNVDPDLLLDIKEAKGYTSFLDMNTFEVKEGSEPDYAELEYYLLTFADNANIPYLDYKMTETVYSKLESRAIAKIEQEQELAEEALQRHKEMLEK